MTGNRNTHRFVWGAISFELGLGGLALLIVWLLGTWVPRGQFDFAGSIWLHLALGLIATVPLLAGMLIIDRYPVGPFQQLKQVIDRLVVPMFRRVPVWAMALIALAAGLGEELLFRWCLQSIISEWTVWWAGWLLGSVAFGICHWINTSYAVVTVLVGLYLGGLMLVTGSVVGPMVTHAVYDLIALIYLTRDEVA